MSTGGYCQHCNSIFQSVREKREHSCEGSEKARQEFASIFPVRTPMPFTWGDDVRTHRRCSEDDTRRSEGGGE